MENLRAARLHCKHCNYRITDVISKPILCCSCNKEMAEIGVRDISLDEYEYMLVSNDWFTHMSDDRSVVDRGIIRNDFLKNIANFHGEKYQDRYFVHHRNGR